MSEMNPLMAMLLGQASFVGPSEAVEDEVQPIDAQYRFGPGDAAILAQANTPLEHDFVVVKCLDASKYSETYPDWEERLMNSFVLCEVFTRSDPNISYGWISRLKLMPVSNYRYRQMRKWLKEGFPPDLPEWVHEYHNKYTDELAKQAPHVVPRTMTCPNCNGLNVNLVVTRTLTYSAKAGSLLHDDVDKIVPISDVDEESEHVAKLRCQDCNSLADLEDSEWVLPGISQ